MFVIVIVIVIPLRGTVIEAVGPKTTRAMTRTNELATEAAIVVVQASLAVLRETETDPQRKVSSLPSQRILFRCKAWDKRLLPTHTKPKTSRSVLSYP